MSQTQVVNLRKSRYDVYIGRDPLDQKSAKHFGNPFSYRDSNIASVKVQSHDEAIRAFYDWLSGAGYDELEPERRQWILDNLDKLRGKRLGCFCHPKLCHGDVYRVMLGEASIGDVIPTVVPKAEQMTLI